MKMSLMKCGHTAMAVDENGNPCCVICHGDPRSQIVEEDLPDLTGRLAKCDCGNTRESSIELPFFEYKGPNSHAAKEMCKLCRYGIIAHLPKWEYRLVMKRDWFKNKNIDDDIVRTEHFPNKKVAENYLQARMNQLLEQSGIPWSYGENKGEIATKIYKINIDYIKGPLPSGTNHEFVSHGPYKYDSYYCGCKGWD